MIKVSAKDNVSVEEEDNIKVKSNKADVSRVEPNKITAHPNNYKIVGDDVYVIKRNNEPEQWFKDMLENQIASSSVNTELNEVKDLFNNFKDGVTKEIGYLTAKDSSTAYELSVLKAQQDDNVAGIFRLDQSKATKDYASAVSQQTLAAWANDAGGAWFDEKISVISSLAKSAASSTSSLSATMQSQQNQLWNAIGDINALKAQTDGVIETWFYTHTPVDGSGNLIPTVEPYATWVSGDSDGTTRGVHTGDTFVQYELDANGNKSYIASWKFTKSAVNTPFTDSLGFNFAKIVDSTAIDALDKALNAQLTADGKINSFYLNYFPTTTTHPTLGEGDLLVRFDTTPANRMYRYDGSTWTEVENSDIKASVDRLDEATVTVDGKATARSSLVVDANGAVSGFVAAAESSPTGNKTTSFKIVADKFTVADNFGNDYGAPIIIEDNKIKFNGEVSFTNITDTDSLATKDELVAESEYLKSISLTEQDVNKLSTNIFTTTQITGNQLTTAKISANNILGGTIAGVEIVGNNITGGSIHGVNITGSIIKGSYIDLLDSTYLTNWTGLKPSNIPSQYVQNFAVDPITGSPHTDSNGNARLVGEKFVKGNIQSALTSSPYRAISNVRSYDNYKYNTKSRLIDKNFTYKISVPNNQKTWIASCEHKTEYVYKNFGNAPYGQSVSFYYNIWIGQQNIINIPVNILIKNNFDNANPEIQGSFNGITLEDGLRWGDFSAGGEEYSVSTIGSSFIVKIIPVKRDIITYQYNGVSIPEGTVYYTIKVEVYANSMNLTGSSSLDSQRDIYSEIVRHYGNQSIAGSFVAMPEFEQTT